MRREKRVPEGLDAWTHWRHGPDGNFVSQDTEVAVPTGPRWVAGPPQDEEGKRWYYGHVFVSANGRNFYASEDRITARDAYNGVLLWKRMLRGHSFRERGTDVPENLRKKLKVGETPIELPSPPLHDGLIVAYGSVYASTRDGAVLCIR